MTFAQRTCSYATKLETALSYENMSTAYALHPALSQCGADHRRLRPKSEKEWTLGWKMKYPLGYIKYLITHKYNVGGKSDETAQENYPIFGLKKKEREA